MVEFLDNGHGLTRFSCIQNCSYALKAEAYLDQVFLAREAEPVFR